MLGRERVTYLEYRLSLCAAATLLFSICHELVLLFQDLPSEDANVTLVASQLDSHGIGIACGLILLWNAPMILLTLVEGSLKSLECAVMCIPAYIPAC